MLGDLDEIKSDKKGQEDEGKNGNDNFEAIFRHGGFGFLGVRRSLADIEKVNKKIVLRLGCGFIEGWLLGNQF